MKTFNAVKEYISQFYSPSEYINLEQQITKFGKNKELSFYSVLDATPVFRNTLVKYLPLLKAKMDLTIGYGNGIPYDEKIIEFLNSVGIKTVLNGERIYRKKFDFILDCAGANANVFANIGYVELTRSGLYKYNKSSNNVFFADESIIKRLETSLGTGDGFLRGMQHFGYNDLRGKKVVIFGFGKVGQGVAYYAAKAGAEVIIVDDAQKITPPDSMKIIDLRNRQQIDDIIEISDVVVSVTGIAGALANTLDIAKLVASSAIIVNMGIYNEFGSAMPNERVLNNNAPLNFVLDEPTHLKYIAPTMALSNYGILELLNHQHDTAKLITPGDKINRELLRAVKEKGCLQEELEFLEKELKVTF